MSRKVLTKREDTRLYETVKASLSSSIPCESMHVKHFCCYSVTTTLPAKNAEQMRLASTGRDLVP